MNTTLPLQHTVIRHRNRHILVKALEANAKGKRALELQSILNNFFFFLFRVDLLTGLAHMYYHTSILRVLNTNLKKAMVR